MLSGTILNILRFLSPVFIDIGLCAVYLRKSIIAR